MSVDEKSAVRMQRDGSDTAPRGFDCGARGQAESMHASRIDALARRAAGASGGVRALLDVRLAELSALRPAGSGDVPAVPHAHDAAAAPRTALSALLEHLAAASAMPAPGPAADTPLAPHGLLDDLRRIGAQARSDSQLRLALEPSPGDAGPLNSARLVHRALALMQDVSPAYLETFLSQVDSLAWLEALAARNAHAPADASPAQASGRRTRAKPRTRRG